MLLLGEWEESVVEFWLRCGVAKEMRAVRLTGLLLSLSFSLSRCACGKETNAAHPIRQYTSVTFGFAPCEDIQHFVCSLACDWKTLSI